jgi:hypothetical protein
VKFVYKHDEQIDDLHKATLPTEIHEMLQTSYKINMFNKDHKIRLK